MEKGWTSQHDVNYALTGIIVISICETLNVISFLQGETKLNFWVPCIIFLAANLFYFFPNRFKTIVMEFKGKPPAPIIKLVSLAYVLVTIIAFGISRDSTF